MSDKFLCGSCLCRSVRYKVRAPIQRFAHCHCSRCRKATGTGHGSYLYVVPADFSWVSGEQHTKRFDLPSAKSFATTFCTMCGSPLPYYTRNGLKVVIPAGSLDDDPDAVPQVRIFWESRAKWEGSADGLPTCAEFPEWWRLDAV